MSANARPINPSGARPTVELLRLATPMILMSLSRVAMGFIDFVMVSWLGTDAQAAISPATLFIWALACAGTGIASGVQTFVAQADGRGERRIAGGYVWQTLYLALIALFIAWPLSQTTAVWLGWFAGLGQHPPTVTALEVEFVRIGVWTAAPVILCAGLDGFFNGIRRPWIVLLAAALSVGVNALGNWLLIFGPTLHLPGVGWSITFPAWGIGGAAVATLIGWCVRAAVLLIVLRHPELDRRYNTRRSFAPCWQKLAGLVRVGGPMSLQWLLDIGSWVVFMWLIMPRFGTYAMAATNIGLQFMHVSFMPAIGIGIALCSQVAHAIGAGRPEEAVRRTRVAFGLTGGYMGLVGLLFLLLREPLVRLLNTDPAVIAAGQIVLVWAAIFQVFDAMGVTYMNALRGAGDTRWPAVLMGVSCWGVFIGGGCLIGYLRPEWGLHGPWAMCTLYIIIVGLGVLWRWRRGHWRSIRLFEEPRAVPLAEAPAGF